MNLPEEESYSLAASQIYTSDKLGQSVISKVANRYKKPEFREAERKKFNPQNFELSNSKDYFEHLSFDINLNKLYKLEETLSNNKNSAFSLVLLRIVDPELIELNGKNKKGQLFKYLLQVWSQKGYLYYERKMAEKPCMMNIIGKVVIFKEDAEDNDVYVVKLRMQKHASLFKFTLPACCFGDRSDKSLVIGFVDGHLIVGLRDKIMYADVLALFSNSKNDEPRTESQESKADAMPKIHRATTKIAQDFFNDEITTDQFFFEFTLDNSDFKDLIVDDEFVPLDFRELSGEEVVSKRDSQLMAVFERTTDHQLVFLKLSFSQEENQSVLSLEYLGDLIKKPSIKPRGNGPIKKWVLSVNQDQSGNPYCVGLVLRDDNTVDFYNDFSLVHTSKAQFEDIDFDFKFLYLKEFEQLEHVTLHRIKTSWQQNIGLHVASSKEHEIKKFAKRWDFIKQKRVSSYMKLYRCCVTYETFFLVAHRNFVSAFNISTETWQHTMYQDQVRELALMNRTVKKRNDDKTRLVEAYKYNFRYSDKYKVAAIVGSNQIHYLSINDDDDFPCPQNYRITETEGTIRRLFKDELKFYGCFILISTQAPKQIMYDDGDNRFNNLGLMGDYKQASHLYKLSYLTENKLWPLMDQADPGDQNAQDVLSDGSSFVNYQATPQGCEDDKPVNMTMIYNPENHVCRSFQIDFKKKTRLQRQQNLDEFSKHRFYEIKYNSDSVYDLKNMGEYCSHQNGLNNLREAVLGVFIVRYENSQFTGSVIVIMKKRFMVFDKDSNLKFIFEGFRIGSVLSSTDWQVYAIFDSVDSYTIKNIEENTQEVIHEPVSAGLYFFDSYRLVEGKHEMYKISSADVGINVELAFSNFSKRMVFMKNHSKAQLCPMVHENILFLNGVSHQNDYLCWREKGGFFTAMNKKGMIQTWSLATGKKLYNMEHPVYGQGLNQELESFEVYQTNAGDQSYLRDNCNYEHVSRSLIVDCKTQLEMKQAYSEFYKAKADRQFHCQTNLSHDTKLLNEKEGGGVKIDRNEKERGIYKFYLLEMKMFGELDNPDYDPEGQNPDMSQDEDVKIAMEFNFEIGEDRKNKSHWADELIPTSHIYISLDKQKLLEVCNRKFAIIYEIDEEKTVDVTDKSDNFSHKRVFWKEKHYIKRFPALLQGQASSNFLFSCNFNYYIDFNFTEDGLVIRDAATQSVHCRVPSAMLNFRNEETIKDSLKVHEMGRNISFFSTNDGGIKENMIRIINGDEVDSIFEFHQDQKLKLLSFNKLDNHHVLINSLKKLKRLDDGYHNICEHPRLLTKNTMARLIRMNQNYQGAIVHEANLKGEVVRNMPDKMYRVDYSQSRNKTASVFVSELSFTVLSWKITERIVNEIGFNVPEVDPHQQLISLFCIFPRQETIMHKLCYNKEPAVSGFMAESVQTLFDVARKGIEQPWSIFGDHQTFEVPFLLDYRECSPIDLALGVEYRVDAGSGQLEANPESKGDENFKDLELAGLFLRNLRGSSFCNHGQLMIETLQTCLEEGVEGIGDYIDSRLMQIKSMPGPIQNDFRKENEDTCVSGTYGVITVCPFADKRDLELRMYKSKGWNQKVQNFVFDIPYLHAFSSESRDFFQALDNFEDIKLFRHKSVQILINYKWKSFQFLIYLLKIIPFALMLVIFMLWSNLILPNSHSNSDMDLVEESFDYRSWDVTSCWILILLSSFFMLTEIEAIVSYPKQYLFVDYGENITDTLPLILMYVVTIWSLRTTGALPWSFWITQSLSGITLWIKFIWFLRSQDFFAYLVRSLVEAIKDIFAFLVILLLVCIGFADAFLTLSRSMGSDMFVDNYYNSFRYTWLFVLGQNEPIENPGYYADILIFIASIVLLIIMLNVLIAIASNSFAHADTNKVEYAYKAKVGLLSQLQAHPLVKLFRRIRGQQRSMSNLLFVSFEQNYAEQ